MLIFPVYESATTLFCLCLLLSVCGICQYFGEKSHLKFHKLPVAILNGTKCKALADQEAEIDSVTPIMVAACLSPSC